MKQNNKHSNYNQIRPNTTKRRRQNSNQSQIEIQIAINLERLKEFFQNEAPQCKQTENNLGKILKSATKLKTIGFKPRY